ncbi:kinase-like protein [Pseudovirgaria hyperparasitica]|uniref:Kinase-like protein n=1 Tax=Pseudovirgaria hyperparasitica TaxID=470096 RepID=A0A6A6WG95_9PEZI|nr:kinase-like protein [Pseudovirgaria hyperparasitica]KAF2761793.1 kinase-like protein [Pseudovirgaria hyperparasitica]
MFSAALKSFSSNISSNYSWSPQPSSTAGPWKIHDAKKRTTGKAASVFIFDKKSLEPAGGGLSSSRSNDRNLKKSHEQVLERLKKEASSLARLRHPSILELAEPVEETRNGGLMFATEAVTASLAGLLSDKDEQERAGGVGGRGSRYVVEEADGTRRRRELEIDELEIQKGLLQIAKGLEFLHESASLVHCNLTPEAIFINSKGDWKISGLGYSSPPENSNAATSVTPIALSEVLNYDARLPRCAQLNLDYTSPDFVMDNNVSSAADMFSLGLIVVALYNSPHKSPLETNGSTTTYKRLFSAPSTTPTPNNSFLSSKSPPRDVVSSLLPRLITRRPAQRFSAREMQQAQYFDNILVSTIRFLESLPAKTPNEKSQFMRGLPRILNQFPKSVLEKKILPALLEEMKDKELLALVLQNVFKMMPLMSNGKRAFVDQVTPKLRETFIIVAKKGTPAPEKDSLRDAGLMVLLENMQVVADNTTGKEFKDDILPIIQQSLESTTHSLVDASLKTLSVILPALDFSTIKNDLFPVIANVFSKTSSMGIKIRGLEAFQTLCGGTPNAVEPEDDLNGFTEKKKGKQNTSCILDKYTIQEKVVPLMKGIKTKEPAVMMAALDVFKEVGKIADSDYLAMDVLPILWTFSLGPLLNLQQFQAFIALIKSLSNKIEQEQTRKLQELSASNSSPAAVRNDFMSFGAVGSANGLNSPTNGDEGDFETLVTGRKGGSASDVFGEQWGSGSASTTLPSRPSVGSRTQSQGAAASFSWSSPSPAPVPQAPQSYNLQPAPPTSRTITPDHTMGSFTPLQPSNLAPSFSQPLQPSRPGAPSMGVLSPTTSTMSPTPSQGRAVDWSAASNAPNMWSNSTNVRQSHIVPSSTSNASFSIAPPPASPYSNFNIAPPPSNNRQTSYQGSIGPIRNNASIGMDTTHSMGMVSNAGPGRGSMGTVVQPQPLQQQTPGVQPGQKQGIDKYESLL